METGREVKSLLSQMDLAVPLCWCCWKVGKWLESGFPQGWWHWKEHDYSCHQKIGGSQGKNGPSRKRVPSASPREETPRTRCMDKGKTPISPKGCAPRERCTDPWKRKSSRSTTAPRLTRDNPKTTRHTPSKRCTFP
jgi:hypothetical protein